MNCYEEDKLQCMAITVVKKRCTRIATHSCGGKLYCDKHNQMAIAERKKPAEKPSKK